jgi:YHS domain-containing protein
MQVTDPVCRITIDSEQAAGREVWQGQIYCFCSKYCRRNSMQLLGVTPTRPANLLEMRIAAERSGSAIEARSGGPTLSVSPLRPSEDGRAIDMDQAPISAIKY